jgi:cytochrome b6
MTASEDPGKRPNFQERLRRIQDRVYDRLFHNYIWQSVFRSGYPSTPRNQMLAIATSIFLHLHPTRLHRTHVKITHTYCLGGLAFFMFLILTVTGILLMFYYVPSTDRAYTDIAALETNVEFGMLMRNLHRWTGHAMVILVFLHMMRVFYTGAYKPPHEFNWVVGVILLVLTLLLSFTGYLLPWDQLALWAVTVGTNMVGSAPYLGDDVRLVLLGGYEVGEGALIRFYTLHVLALPLLAAIFMAVHFWRIRRDGGMAEPL